MLTCKCYNYDIKVRKSISKHKTLAYINNSTQHYPKQGSPKIAVSLTSVVLQAQTKSFMGMPASMRAKLAAFMQAAKCPESEA